MDPIDSGSIIFGLYDYIDPIYKYEFMDLSNII